MKHTILPHSLILAAVATWVAVVIAMPPGNLSWRLFFDDPAPVAEKVLFLARTYLWPAVLSFSAITLFQLQFRLSTSSGASKRTVFSICLLASMSTLMGLQRLSLAPNSAPAYALGMALAYMATSRMYAVRMRKLWRVSVPWVIWRGNPEAMRQMDRLVAEVREARARNGAGTGSPAVE